MNPDLQSIYSSLNSVYDPQRQAIQQQIGNVQQGQTAQLQGLQQTQKNAFNDIDNSANARGLMYSGAPIAEQQKYTGGTYLPAVANLQAQTNQNVYGLHSAYNGLGTQQTQQAAGMFDANRSAANQQTFYNQQLQSQQQQANQYLEQLKANNRSLYSGGSSGGGGGGQAAATPQYSYGQGKNGGFNFYGPNGQAVSAGQYAQGMGWSPQQLGGLFGQSKNPNDAAIARDLNSGVNINTLKQRYSNAFRGL